jgi:O-antigen chain-terminating methyltransferase
VLVEETADCVSTADLGCGRGELLWLLREAGVEARGVDADADMAAYARGEGLDVQQEDALRHLLDEGKRV